MSCNLWILPSWTIWTLKYSDQQMWHLFVSEYFWETWHWESLCPGFCHFFVQVFFSHFLSRDQQLCGFNRITDQDLHQSKECIYFDMPGYEAQISQISEAILHWDASVESETNMGRNVCTRVHQPHSYLIVRRPVLLKFTYFEEEKWIFAKKQPSLRKKFKVSFPKKC